MIASRNLTSASVLGAILVSLEISFDSLSGSLSLIFSATLLFLLFLKKYDI